MMRTKAMFALMIAALTVTAACAPRPTGSTGSPIGSTGSPTGSAGAPTEMPTVAPTEMPTVAPTDTPAPTPTAAPTATFRASWFTPEDLERFPRDEYGRVLDGPNFPLVNYSPTMITGKPCPRVRKWGIKVIKLQPPANDINVPDNPCVVQNAVDDFVPTFYFNPGGYTQESYPAIAALLDSDPVVLGNITEEFRQDMKEWMDWNYRQCDKPTYRLLDVSSSSRLNSYGDGIVLRVVRAAADAQPFRCEYRRYKDGSLIRTDILRERDMTGPAPDWLYTNFYLVYDQRSGKWKLRAGVLSDGILDYRDTVLRLFKESPFKP